MKTLLCLFGFMVFTTSYSQHQLSISYDNAGNQIMRKLICISCRTGNAVKKMEDITSVDLLTADTDPTITYYPNPVLEKLYVKWDMSKYNVTSVEVYSLSGQNVFYKGNLADTDNISVDFKNVAQGMYTVLLICSNGERKDLMVIKK